ncbi:hypothetical protein [Dactylosporangium salmoneum]|uniref:Uncharacterized protein n=1 Tax=Dactylosporangium salmoneum TaxID=53361 RepID=A0ABN3HN68_9ACTN
MAEHPIAAGGGEGSVAGCGRHDGGVGGELLGTGTGSTGANSSYVRTGQLDVVGGQFQAIATSLTGSTSYDPLGEGSGHHDPESGCGKGHHPLTGLPRSARSPR